MLALIIVVVALAIALTLSGCGTSPHATTTTTTTAGPHWIFHNGTHCYNMHGATECERYLDANVTECQAKCLNLEHCEGFSIKANGVGCFMQKDIVLVRCMQDADFNSYFYSSRTKHLFADFLIVKQSKTGYPSNETVVKQANEMYNRNDTGVLLHVTDFSSGVVATRPHIAFSVVNKFAFEPNGPISIWKGGCPTDGHPPAGATIIATPSAMELMLCFYPCDGASDDRSNNGCGIPGAETCSSANKSDWCGRNYSSLHDDGPGFPCALHPSQLADGLQLYKRHKEGYDWPLKRICSTSKTTPWLPPPSGAWNEATIDGVRWNEGLKDFVWAFVITDCCQNNADCLKATLAQHGDFVQKFGDVPLLALNRFDQTEPFQLLEDKKLKSNLQHATVV